MKKLNKGATAIFLAMIDQMKATGESHIKIDNNPPNSGYMAVHLEDLGYSVNLSGTTGTVISIAHYYEQNGDMMRDPDVEFIFIDNRTEDPQNIDLVGVYPFSFRQDGLGIMREDARIENGKVTTYKPSQQRDNVLFCNQWMRNIQMQQNIKPLKNKPVDAGRPSITNIYEKANQAAKRLGFKSLSAAYSAGKQDEVIAELAKM